MFWFCCGWILWCTLHSLLIDPKVAAFIKERTFIKPSHYRLYYNLFSLASLLPLLAMTVIDRGDAVFSWTGWGMLLRFLLFATAIVCFLGGAKRYDITYFLGLQQVQDGRESVLLGEDQSFSEGGVFGIVRHPWYLGSLLFIWSVFPTYYSKNVAIAVILSVYLIVGTILEERKIVAEYGDRYRAYQKRVSMFVPVKWLMRDRKKSL